MIIKTNQILKLVLHQNIACYRNPITAEIIETYPLPPPSTILGFLYSLIGRDDPTPDEINLSIQGKYNSLIRDYQWYKKYSRKYGRNKQPHPILVHTLYDVKLVIHIYCSNNELTKYIKDTLHHPPYFSYLGRAEDLVKIESIGITQQKIISKEYDHLKLDAYIPTKLATKIYLEGILYKLPSYLKLIEISTKTETKNIRDFHWVDLMYIEANTRYEGEELSMIMDDQGDYIWWCMQNPIP